MNWVQEHLQLIIAAAAAIAYFFNRQRSAHDENDETQRPTEQASPEHAMDAPSEERVQLPVGLRSGQCGAPRFFDESLPARVLSVPHVQATPAQLAAASHHSRRAPSADE